MFKEKNEPVQSLQICQKKKINTNQQEKLSIEERLLITTAKEVQSLLIKHNEISNKLQILTESENKKNIDKFECQAWHNEVNQMMQEDLIAQNLRLEFLQQKIILEMGSQHALQYAELSRGIEQIEIQVRDAKD